MIQSIPEGAGAWADQPTSTHIFISIYVSDFYLHQKSRLISHDQDILLSFTFYRQFKSKL
jgi:hypothetical protein